MKARAEVCERIVMKRRLCPDHYVAVGEDMSEAELLGDCRPADGFKDCANRYPESDGRSRRRRRSVEPEPKERDVVREIGAVAAVLQGASLLGDPDVMKQFQEFAEALLSTVPVV
jgi:hypothetical protein